MEILKKVGARDLYPAIKDVAYSSVYDALQRSMPDEASLFAEVRKGVDDINWVHPEEGWRSYSEADEVLREMILEEVRVRMSAVRAKAQQVPALSHYIDGLTMTPGDEFYYFRFSPSGALEVVITGWGYRKPQRVGVADMDMGINVKRVQRVVVTFVNDGQHLANHPFSILSPYRVISKVSGSDGMYLVGESISVGRVLSFRDDASGREFTITVTLGQEVYEFDLTPPRPTTFTMSPVILVRDTDGISQSEVACKVALGTNVTVHRSDALGSITLPQREFSLTAPNTMIVTLYDNEAVAQTYQVTEEQREYVFTVPRREPEPEPEPEPAPVPEPEPEPEPAPQPVEVPIVRIAVKDVDGHPLDDLPVCVVPRAGVSYNLTTDDQGYVYLAATEFVPNQKVKVYFSYGDDDRRK